MKDNSTDVCVATALLTILYNKRPVTKDEYDWIKTRFRLAELLNKPRYLLIEKGVSSNVSTQFIHMGWSKIRIFKDNYELSDLMMFLNNESIGVRYNV